MHSICNQPGGRAQVCEAPPLRSPIYAAMTNPSMVDFPGRMAAVMFTTGCNFRCGFCHNAALLGTERKGYSWERLESMVERFRRQWVDAVVITGGEPTLATTLLDTIHFFKDKGLAVKLDTNGSRPDVLRVALPLIDYVAMDVKCALETYPSFVTFRDTAAIAESIDMLKQGGVPYEFRTTIVEGVHTDAEMHRIAALLEGSKVYALQPFIPREDLPDPALRQTARTTPQALEHAAALVRPAVGEVRIRGQ